MNYQSIRNDIEQIVRKAISMADEAGAWATYEIGHLMARIITDGIDIEFALTDGDSVCYCDNIRNLVGAINYELNEAVVF
jgi:hypothetical protein